MERGQSDINADVDTSERRLPREIDRETGPSVVPDPSPCRLVLFRLGEAASVC
jgi:hypothetical protein